ncbi:thiamine diphosphokinase [Hutsoniella sourekii]|uniref:thiamine diphosphokinase n=1 Tax=Hutsoniella sourekii TaxID=87650 RepID=UPI0004B46F3D|nr:thiamine diphosphokinase [Hutsoniella sourekii]
MDEVAPLVILCGGAGEPAIDQLQEYIEYHSNSELILIGVDRGSLSLLSAFNRLDLAIGDFDSVSKEEKDKITAKADKILTHPSQKDDTDMELALEFAKNHYPNSKYVILGGLGQGQGRLDHLLSNIWLAYQPRFQSIIHRVLFLEKNHLAYFLKPGQHEIKNFICSRYLSFISLTPVKDFEIKGAYYELDSTSFSYPRALISNEFLSGQSVKVELSQGLILVMEVDEDK